MASVTRDKKRPLGLTLIMLLVLVVVGFLATQWLTSLVLSIVRLILVIVALAVMAKLGLYLLRKGKPPSDDE